MTQEEILEYNKRCAEFLIPDNNSTDYYLPKFGLYLNRYGEVYYEEVFRIDEMKFHSDWNWIMEVVEKIQTLDKLGGIVMIQQGRCKITSRSAGDNTIYADVSYYYLHGMKKQKEAVVEAINQFLIWYNVQTNQ